MNFSFTKVKNRNIKLYRPKYIFRHFIVFKE